LLNEDDKLLVLEIDDRYRCKNYPEVVDTDPRSQAELHCGSVLGNRACGSGDATENRDRKTYRNFPPVQFLLSSELLFQVSLPTCPVVSWPPLGDALVIMLRYPCVHQVHLAAAGGLGKRQDQY
jgi:hypothetical protein